MDDVMFLYNAENGRNSKTMHMFRPVCQVAASVKHQTTLFGRDRQVAAPAGEVCLFDCMLLLFCGVFRSRIS